MRTAFPNLSGLNAIAQELRLTSFPSSFDFCIENPSSLFCGERSSGAASGRAELIALCEELHSSRRNMLFGILQNGMLWWHDKVFY